MALLDAWVAKEPRARAEQSPSQPRSTPMRTLKQFTVFLAAIVAVTILCAAFKTGAHFEGIVTAAAIILAAVHATKSWQQHNPAILCALTFPFNEAGKPLGAKFGDRGCLSCPAGSAFTSDVALNTLERVTNNVLREGVLDFNMPNFPLADREIRAAQFQQMSINSKVRHHVFFDEVHRTKWYNPMPSLETFTVTRELLAQCNGDLATARMLANSNSIGCAPPRGARGISGKDRYTSTAATAVFELGPFCVTDFLEAYDFAMMLDAYKRAAIEASGMALEYEKIRRFVEMSRNNGSAVAGTTSPQFFESTFGHIPNSPGSIEWLLNAIDKGIGGEINPNVMVNVSMSPQTFQYYIEKFARDHNIAANFLTEPGQFRLQTQAYITAFDEKNGSLGFTMQSRRTGRKIRLDTTKTPVYVEFTRNGNAGEWAFQRYFVTQLGDDAETNQANGFRREMNTAYGDACAVEYCPGAHKVLAELLLIDVPGAFHYEAFPTNPLGTQIASGVQTNLNNLWGATEIMWHFGTAVDLYWLKPMNEQLAAIENANPPCFSNIDNTWFAGRLKVGCQFVEDSPRQMMTLAIKVPSHMSVIEKSECCLPSDPPAAISITAEPGRDPRICTQIPAVEADADAAGCMIAPKRMSFQLPSNENLVVAVQFQRRNGLDGTLTVPFTIVNGTATEGAAGTDHFLRADGNIVFADGEDTALVNFTLRPIHRETGDPAFVQAIMRFDNDPVVICGEDGATVDTTLCFTLANQLADDSEGCPGTYCLQAAGMDHVQTSP